MYVAVIGAGAIGSSVGALLTRAGHRCVLVARPAHLTAMRTAGLQLTSAMGVLTMRVEAVPRLTDPPDLALLTTKAYDAAEAIRDNAAALGEGPVVVVQNGLRGTDSVRHLLAPERICGAVAMMAASYLEPGLVAVPYLGSMIVGRAEGPPDAAVRTAAQVLGDALPTFTTKNLRGAQWTKLLINLNNAVAALTGFDDRRMLRTPALVRIGRSLVREGLAVADAAQIRLESLPGAPAWAVRLLSRLPDPVSAAAARGRARRLRIAGPIVLSSLQSVYRQRPTEVEYLNGEIVRAGQRFGVTTPVNRRVLELTQAAERSPRRYAPDELADLLRRDRTAGDAHV